MCQYGFIGVFRQPFVSLFSTRPYFMPLVLTPNRKLLLHYPSLNLPVLAFPLGIPALANFPAKRGKIF
jgi:hypothetical protein